jgi:N-acetylneuraminate synthase
MYPQQSQQLNYIENKESIYDVVKKYELPIEWVAELMDFAKQHGMTFFSSVCSEHDADEMKQAGMDIFKITSSELTHLPLIKHTASFGKPMILSTGMATGYGTIEEAVNTCLAAGNKQIALFHCIAIYPTPLDQCNLGVIPSMKQIFQLPVGWSDHTKEPIEAPYVSTLLGADMIEKHFTLDRSMPGPDQHFAVEPKMLKQLVEAVRKAESLSEQEKQKELEKYKNIIGDRVRRALTTEDYLRAFVSRRIFASSPIKKGDRITKNNISVLRPGGDTTGIPARFYDIILQARVNKALKEGDPVTWNSILDNKD